VKYYICLELGGTNLRYAMVDENFSPREFKKIPSGGLARAKNKIDYLYGILADPIDLAGKDNVLAVSMALSSLMDRDRTTVYSSPMVKGFENIRLVPELQDKFALPLFLEKDVNVLLLYELSRLQKPVQGIAVGVFIGTGLGNALCIDGRLYRGYSGAACELGHIPVPGLKKMCGCGKPGCIELKACGKVLDSLAAGKYHCSVKEIFTLHGDKKDVQRMIYNCAIAVAAEVSILDPSVVLLGGGVTELPGFPYQGLVALIKENVRYPNPRETLDIRRASGDKHAGVIGAAINASHRLNGLVYTPSI
jgi:allose kinase